MENGLEIRELPSDPAPRVEIMNFWLLYERFFTQQ